MCWDEYVQAAEEGKFQEALRDAHALATTAWWWADTTTPHDAAAATQKSSSASRRRHTATEAPPTAGTAALSGRSIPRSPEELLRLLSPGSGRLLRLGAPNGVVACPMLMLTGV